MDFKKSFQIGISAARNLEKEKLEIDSIFKELNKQINEVTNGKINILIISQSDLTTAVHSINNLINGIETKKSFYIAAELCAITPTKTAKIAKWKTSIDGGYPCIITYNEQEGCAYDKDSLIFELNNLIESTHCGLIFKHLLEQAEKI